jgi:hypothetical protein
MLARRVTIVLVAASGLIPLGCHATTEIVEGPAYPAAASRGQTLDVQVTRDTTKISFTNTTATTLGPGRLWINGWFSRDFPEIAPGESISFDLYEFKDRYGTAFRGGGFFASERPDRVVLVEIEPITPTADASKSTLLGLVVVKGDE